MRTFSTWYSILGSISMVAYITVGIVTGKSDEILFIGSLLFYILSELNEIKEKQNKN